MTVRIERTLDWRAVARVAAGEDLVLSAEAAGRIEAARRLVEVVVERGILAYGINTGIGALSQTLVDRPAQRRLSRNLLMSHACGAGPRLEPEAVRAIMAVQANAYAHGWSGLRLEVVETLLGLIAAGCAPDVPAGGSVGYLTHAAHIGLVLIGEGSARIAGREMSGAEALAEAGLSPLVLQEKEGLCLINGSPCATGIACLALARIERLAVTADAVAALSLEALGAQMAAFDEAILAVRVSPGIAASGAALRAWLAGSQRIRAFEGRRLQDALSLRAVPHVHGALRDAAGAAGTVADRELASVTDNPILSGTPEAPSVHSEAHSVAPGLALMLDGLAIAVAQTAAMSERRLDRLVNPLVSGLPPFLAADPGAASGFMIAQYTAAALAAENRRLAAPASLDGGVTSGLQEDFLVHPTAAATKLFAIVENAERIFGIELLAAAEAGDLAVPPGDRAPGTAAIHDAVRAVAPPYRDDRPLAWHLETGRDLVRAGLPAAPGAA